MIEGAILGASIAGAGIAAVAIGYQSMSPTGQWFGKTFNSLSGEPRLLAFTYDDGPNPRCTPRLLEILAKHDVKATFFLIGRHVQEQPALAREVAAAGHAIGNHTFTHPNLIFASETQTRRELQQCEDTLTQVVGAHSNLFRPPYGGRRPSTLRTARDMGLLPIMWSVTGWDWDAPPADVIVEKVTKQIKGGDVIMLHDGGHSAPGADREQTVKATDQLISRYKSEGFEFVTIPEMMKRASTAED